VLVIEGSHDPVNRARMPKHLNAEWITAIHFVNYHKTNRTGDTLHLNDT